MEKVVINKDACIGCGLCVHSHPDYLIFDEMGQADPVNRNVDPKDKKALLETVEHCPTQAFKVEDIKEENENHE